MDFAALVINVAVPVGTVLLAFVVYAPLSALFWRQFLKLSVSGLEIGASDFQRREKNAIEEAARVQNFRRL